MEYRPPASPSSGYRLDPKLSKRRRAASAKAAALLSGSRNTAVLSHNGVAIPSVPSSSPSASSLPSDKYFSDPVQNQSFHASSSSLSMSSSSSPALSSSSSFPSPLPKTKAFLLRTSRSYIVPPSSLLASLALREHQQIKELDSQGLIRFPKEAIPPSTILPFSSAPSSSSLSSSSSSSAPSPSPVSPRTKSKSPSRPSSSLSASSRPISPPSAASKPIHAAASAAAHDKAAATISSPSLSSPGAMGLINDRSTLAKQWSYFSDGAVRVIDRLDYNPHQNNNNSCSAADLDLSIPLSPSATSPDIYLRDPIDIISPLGNRSPSHFESYDMSLNDPMTRRMSPSAPPPEQAPLIIPAKNVSPFVSSSRSKSNTFGEPPALSSLPSPPLIKRPQQSPLPSSPSAASPLLRTSPLKGRMLNMNSTFGASSLSPSVSSSPRSPLAKSPSRSAPSASSSTFSMSSPTRALAPVIPELQELAAGMEQSIRKQNFFSKTLSWNPALFPVSEDGVLSSSALFDKRAWTIHVAEALAHVAPTFDPSFVSLGASSSSSSFSMDSSMSAIEVRHLAEEIQELRLMEARTRTIIGLARELNAIYNRVESARSAVDSRLDELKRFEAKLSQDKEQLGQEHVLAAEMVQNIHGESELLLDSLSKMLLEIEEERSHLQQRLVELEDNVRHLSLQKEEIILNRERQRITVLRQVKEYQTQVNALRASVRALRAENDSLESGAKQQQSQDASHILDASSSSSSSFLLHANNSLDNDFNALNTSASESNRSLADARALSSSFEDLSYYSSSAAAAAADAENNGDGDDSPQLPPPSPHNPNADIRTTPLPEYDEHQSQQEHINKRDFLMQRIAPSALLQASTRALSISYEEFPSSSSSSSPSSSAENSPSSASAQQRNRFFVPASPSQREISSSASLYTFPYVDHVAEEQALAEAEAEEAEDLRGSYPQFQGQQEQQSKDQQQQFEFEEDGVEVIEGQEAEEQEEQEEEQEEEEGGGPNKQDRQHYVSSGPVRLQSDDHPHESDENLSVSELMRGRAMSSSYEDLARMSPFQEGSLSADSELARARAQTPRMISLAHAAAHIYSPLSFDDEQQQHPAVIVTAQTPEQQPRKSSSPYAFLEQQQDDLDQLYAQEEMQQQQLLSSVPTEPLNVSSVSLSKSVLAAAEDDDEFLTSPIASSSSSSSAAAAKSFASSFQEPILSVPSFISIMSGSSSDSSSLPGTAPVTPVLSALPNSSNDISLDDSAIGPSSADVSTSLMEEDNDDSDSESDNEELVHLEDDEGLCEEPIKAKNVPSAASIPLKRKTPSPHFAAASAAESLSPVKKQIPVVDESSSASSSSSVARASPHLVLTNLFVLTFVCFIFFVFGFYARDHAMEIFFRS